jgi:carbamoyl-phosphate synthase small subunit
VIVRDLSIVVSNYRSVMTLDEYCKKHNVLGISGIDTRALTKVCGAGQGLLQCV